MESPRSLSRSRNAPNAKPEKRPPPLANLPITFIGSFPDPDHPLDPPLPEIAFVGRSNVGKSRLLNALVGRKRLARVSGTPGKTQMLNVYLLPTFYLVDLPGYGWARTSARERAEYRRLLERYLTARERIGGVVWLLDIRHAPSADDRAIQELLIATGRRCLTVLTKGDKLSRARRLETATQRARDLGLPDERLLITSSESGEGIADLGESILDAVE